MGSLGGRGKQVEIGPLWVTGQQTLGPARCRLLRARLRALAALPPDSVAPGPRHHRPHLPEGTTKSSVCVSGSPSGLRAQLGPTAAPGCRSRREGPVASASLRMILLGVDLPPKRYAEVPTPRSYEMGSLQV